MRDESNHPARLISDARRILGIAQGCMYNKYHRRAIQKIRQELDRILSS